jgi:hypothetical protein
MKKEIRIVPVVIVFTMIISAVFFVLELVVLMVNLIFF